MAPRKSMPSHKRAVATLLESQAAKLRAFADSQVQPPKRAKTGGRRTATGMSYDRERVEKALRLAPDAPLADYATMLGVSIATACRWRKRCRAESDMMAAPLALEAERKPDGAV